MTLSHEMEACRHLCWLCHTTCQSVLINHCLEKGGEHVEKGHVQVMLDCIQICQTAADFMTRGSALHKFVCDACSKICEACATSCEKIDTEEMKRCASVCRQCAVRCQSMLI